MKRKRPATRFAPAERLSADEVAAQAKALNTAALLTEILNGTTCPTAVLNQCRQIVFCNRALTDTVGGHEECGPVGLRQGEALRCVHAGEAEGGCGTTEFCRVCGAVLAILEGQSGRPSVRECRMIRRVNQHDEWLNLLVSVSPLKVLKRFVVCAISDISDLKRRQALEQIFFHDLLNAAGALQFTAGVLTSLLPAGSIAAYARKLEAAAAQLAAHIESHRQLSAAEDGELSLALSQTRTLKVLNDLADTYRSHPAAQRRVIRIDEASPEVTITTDLGLLVRALGNMLKNALEASADGATVQIGCRVVGEEVEFYVHNDEVLPPEVRLQVFQRWFTTKGQGRGLGTYSLKLLSERYLRGRVTFTSEPGAGTTFLARYPRTLG